MKIPILSPSKFLFSVFAVLLFPILSNAQKQPNIPMPRGPVDLSETSNLIIFIVIPAIIIITFLFYRKRIKKINEEKKARMKDRNENGNKKH